MNVIARGGNGPVLSDSEKNKDRTKKILTVQSGPVFFYFF